MLSTEQHWAWLNNAELIHSATTVREAVTRMAKDIEQALKERYPLVLSVMGGAVVFTGHLLPLLRFPLSFDIIRASRYGAFTTGGQLKWSVLPEDNVAGRTVLVLDDILDQGQTLAAIREQVLKRNAAAFYSAVLVEKEIGAPKPIRADFVGLSVPNRYVFGFGMDVHGAWRNLPEIYALRGEKFATPELKY